MRVKVYKFVIIVQMREEKLTKLPETVDTILSRRSIKNGFTDTPVNPMVVDNIIECGLNAPSSKNAQPWKMHVVENRLTLNGIAQYINDISECRKKEFVPHDPRSGRPRTSYTSSVSESAQVLSQVPLGIFIENRGKFSISRSYVAEADKQAIKNALIGLGLEYLGLGASIQSMWLAAQSHKLRGVFMGDVLIAEDYIKDQLGMTGDLVGVLALGYSDTPPTPKVIQNHVVRHE